MTLTEFYTRLLTHRGVCPNLRTGAYFVEHFDVPKDDPLVKKLWKLNGVHAQSVIMDVIKEYELDPYNLPLREYLPVMIKSKGE